MCVITATMAGGAAAATMANVSLATTALSTIVSGAGMYAQGQQAAATAKANAKIATENAKISKQKARDAEYRGVLDRQQIALNEESMRSTGRTAYAGGNVQLGSGSPVDWEVDLTERAAADKRTSKNNAAIAAWGERVNASSSTYQAKLYNMSGANSASAGVINAGTSLLAGAGTVANKYYTYSR